MRLGLTRACRSDLINPGVRHCNLAVRSPAIPWVPRHLPRFSPGNFGSLVPSSLAEGRAKTRTKEPTSGTSIFAAAQGFWGFGVKTNGIGSRRLSWRSRQERRVDGVGAL